MTKSSLIGVDCKVDNSTKLNITLAFNNCAARQQTEHGDFQMPLDVLVLGSVCFPLVLLIGIVSNMLVIYVLFKEREMRSVTSYLLANLSTCDILLLAVCVPSSLNDVT
jgi:hypothetical protein